MIRPEWLQPAADGPPCGPNLEYDPEFLELMRKARGTPDEEYGKFIKPAEEPDWADVFTRASALLDRSRDLRVVQVLARALAHMEGLSGLRNGLTLLRDLLENFWESVHPQLEFEGEPDPVLRANAVGQFADPEGLVRDVRLALFLRSALGIITVRDVVRVLEPTTGAADLTYTREQLSLAIRDAIVVDAGALTEAGDCVRMLDRSRLILIEHLESTHVPDLAPLRSVLNSVDEFAGRIRAEVVAPATAGVVAAGGGNAPGVVAVGEIRSREDALRSLDRVCEFLARSEPTNPAPLLIRRAQRLMTLPFLDIIRELAPDAAGQIENITGARQA